MGRCMGGVCLLWALSGCEGASTGADGGAVEVQRTAVADQEPNNATTQPQSLGSFSTETHLRVTGRSTTGGYQGGNYTGDLDVFATGIQRPGWIVFEVNWVGDADVDLVAFRGSEAFLTDTTNAKPISVGRALIAADFGFYVASATQPADWTLDFDYYPSQVLLTGSYSGNTGGGTLSTYAFQANGRYDRTLSLSSGDIYSSGIYAVWGDEIIMTESDGSKVYGFRQVSANTIEIGATTYRAY